MEGLCQTSFQSSDMALFILVKNNPTYVVPLKISSLEYLQTNKES